MGVCVVYRRTYIIICETDARRKKHCLAIKGTRLKNLLRKYLLFSQNKKKNKKSYRYISEKIINGIRKTVLFFAVCCKKNTYRDLTTLTYFAYFYTFY